MRKRLIGWVVVASSVLALSCGGTETDSEVALRDAEPPIQTPPPTMNVPAPLPAAYCEVNVTGTGVIDLETEYLPNVVRCENGGANLEALKAQAIAARSVAYYNMSTSGEICDSQGCQVFTCNGEPNALQIQAVEETSGMYLMYNETLTYGFYVAGDNNTAPPACVGVSGSTEGWVTYNSGQSGTNVEQTELGFVFDPGDSGYGQNRGCMSQWGARCLENENGADYMDILRFYYGEDIEVIQAAGKCVLPVDTTDGTASDSAGEESGSTSGGPPDSTSGDPTNPTTDDPTDANPGDESSGGVGGTDASASAGGEEEGGDLTAGDGESSGGDSRGGNGGLPDGFGEGPEEGGCGCTSGDDETPAGAVLFALGLFGLRRRRR